MRPAYELEHERQMATMAQNTASIYLTAAATMRDAMMEMSLTLRIATESYVRLKQQEKQ